jgi:hypothetical protein
MDMHHAVAVWCDRLLSLVLDYSWPAVPSTVLYSRGCEERRTNGYTTDTWHIFNRRSTLSLYLYILYSRVERRERECNPNPVIHCLYCVAIN